MNARISMTIMRVAFQLRILRSRPSILISASKFPLVILIAYWEKIPSKLDLLACFKKSYNLRCYQWDYWWRLGQAGHWPAFLHDPLFAWNFWFSAWYDLLQCSCLSLREQLSLVLSLLRVLVSESGFFLFQMIQHLRRIRENRCLKQSKSHSYDDVRSKLCLIT